MSLELATEPTFGHVARSMAKAMDQMQKGFFGYPPGQVWAPNVNVYESETTYLVCVDLAGVECEKISVMVSESILRIRGQRPAPLPPKDECGRYRVHLMEIDHGTFARAVDLPNDVNEEGISARCENGLLWIILPKRAE